MPDCWAPLAGQHLLDGLAGNPELAADVGLRKPFVDEGLDQLPPFRGKLPDDLVVLEQLGSYCLQMVERLLVRRDVNVFSHAASMTTPGCHVNPWLSTASGSAGRSAAFTSSAGLAVIR